LLFSFRDLYRILTSTALSNGFLVVLSLLLARANSPADYAEFAFSVAVFACSSLLLDFGLNISVIKRQAYGVYKDTPMTFASVKLAVAIVLLFVSVMYIIFLDGTLVHFGLFVGFTCASFNNVWLALRVADQSSGDTSRFYKANRELFFLRVVTVVATYLAGLEPLHYLLALYLYPFIVLFSLQKTLFQFRQHFRIFIASAPSVLSYSKWVFLSSLLFVASVQIPVLSLKVLADDLQIATLGVAMTVASVSSWLSSSLKPFIIGRYLSSAYNQGSFFRLFILFFIVILLTSVPVYFAFFSAFSDKYPGVEQVGTVVFIYTSLVFILGIYNSQIHVSGRPELEALVNFLRVLSILTIIYLQMTSLLNLVICVGLAMVVSEVLLVSINYKLKKNNTEYKNIG